MSPNSLPDFPVSDLLVWYRTNKRSLPWRNTDDPFKIWVSEIMLQQTRVDTAIPYFKRFIRAFPDIETLAKADRQKVLKLWEGLGYYSRCRNLHDAAKTVVTQFNGKLPDTYSDITSLKGIGPYTSAAILSIAFNKKYAVVDGNVLRVIARYNGFYDDIRSTKTKREIQNYVDKIIPADQPGDFNQSVMELGAVICTPNNPNCNICPLQTHCIAFKTAKTDVIPYKSPSKKIPHKIISVGIIVNKKNEILISLRPEKSMLGGLWEFPGGKKRENETIKETLNRELNEELDITVDIFDQFAKVDHAYSHFKITLYAYFCKIINGKPKPLSSDQIRWVSVNDLDQYPFPKANKTIIEKLKHRGSLSALKLGE